MAESILTSEDCVKILQNYFKVTDFEYLDSKLLLLSDTNEGYLGEHYRLQITYRKNGKEDKKCFFVKTKPTKNTTQKEIAERTSIYTKEIFLYDFLFKEFEKYGYDTSFAAKTYYSVPNETLVMDDLTLQGFVMQERRKHYNLEQLKCTLKSLALYHAAGFAYQHTKSKELGRKFELGVEYPLEFSEIFFRLYTANTAADQKFWIGNFRILDELIDELPQNKSYKEEFKSLIKKADICKFVIKETNLPKTCCHGDLWSNNMLFKYENNDLKQCCLVDYQLCRYFYPSVDVILAIYSNTNREFRKKYLKNLYEYYYDTLATVLDNYGLLISNIMSLEDYYRSIEFVKVDLLVQVLIVNSVIYIPTDFLTEVIKKGDETFSKVLHDKSFTLDAFKKDDKFKEVIIECLEDLHEALVEKLCK